jgi:diketogulonate reductase-like aldo/keto reductase
MQALNLGAGLPMPVLGFGTWQLPGQQCVDGVLEALELGYRHIDTARIYGNEAEVGQALAQSPVPRDQVFVTTKIWWDDLHPDRIADATQGALERLDLDRVDLLLIHWPRFEQGSLEDLVAAFADVQSRGWTTHIGVSNFNSAMIHRAAAVSRIAANQVEYHPYLAQAAVLDACRAHDVALTAYSPLARGKLLQDPVLSEIGARHDRSAAQTALRWLTQQPGVSAIPKASSTRNRAANLASQTVDLSADEMATIHGLARPDGRVVSPPWATEWDPA